MIEYLPKDLTTDARPHEMVCELAAAAAAYVERPTFETALTLRGAVCLVAENIDANRWEHEAANAPFHESKAKQLLDPGSCWNRAELTEPVFVLRAKDPLAPAVVRVWSTLASTAQAHDDYKQNTALALANVMDEWRQQFGERDLTVALRDDLPF